jgi:phosphoketolase
MVATDTGLMNWRPARIPVEPERTRAVDAQDTMVFGKILCDVAKLHQGQRKFRIFGPDETLSLNYLLASNEAR